MKLEWDYTAETFFDQLPADQQARVLRSVEALPAEWDLLEGTQMQRLLGFESDLYTLRIGLDLIVLVRRENDRIRIVDIVRRSQIDGLRRAMMQGQTAPG